VSGGTIKFGLWGDSSPTFWFGPDDLFSDGNSPPVSVSKREYKDTINRVVVVWTNVDNNFTHATAIANDEVDQRKSSKVRTKVFKLLGITSASLANKMAYKLLAESMYRYNHYTFTLAYKSMAVEVGDVGELSDGFLITNHKIRIVKITEVTDGRRLRIEAVEDKSTMYLDTDYEASDSKHVIPEAPVLVSPKVYFTESLTEPKIYLHICPQDENCNGWAIYYSLDDLSYTYAGVCTVDLSTAANLDGEVSASSLSAWPAAIRRRFESLTITPNVSFVNLNTVSSEEYYNNSNLIKVGSEVMGFKTATNLEGVWVISDLRRGLFNTEATTHANGSAVHTLQRDFEFNFQPEDVGKTIYFKVLTHYGSDIQQLDEVSPTSYVIRSEYLRPAPLSLLRIRGREGHNDYGEDDVIIDFYFSSKSSGFGRGGYGEVLWDSYVFNKEQKYITVRLEEEDGTLIKEEIFELPAPHTEYSLRISAADRNGKDPVRVKMTPGTSLACSRTREMWNYFLKIFFH